ncbi:DUF924 family protein [Rubellimicrobium arenae]|uniref:DUF924 family protein n=1 Tax=Rubellimicrobium arenae TaxID=2817372 RepID=UPI001B301719|nr:DUF924 family protein [Rubellimicrobium arenae]
MILPSAKDVLEFWFQEIGEARWFNGGDELDGMIRDRFLPLWERAMEGRLGLWLTTPPEALAYVILLDQFPRNMFRGDALSFASDAHARAAAKTVISRDWDLKLAERERIFLYLPLEHSENLVDQDRCVRLVKARMPELGADYLLHARAHREQIRRFGRFPTRNASLRRTTTPDEQAFLDRGGYPALVEELKAGAD